VLEDVTLSQIQQYVENLQVKKILQSPSWGLGSTCFRFKPDVCFIIMTIY
jgi:hypothetical protein